MIIVVESFKKLLLLTRGRSEEREQQRKKRGAEDRVCTVTAVVGSLWKAVGVSSDLSAVAQIPETGVSNYT